MKQERLDICMLAKIADIEKELNVGAVQSGVPEILEAIKKPPHEVTSVLQEIPALDEFTPWGF